MKKQSFVGRVAIITGGAGGVGRTVSKRWIDAGASVMVVDHSQSMLDAWLAESSTPEWKDRVATVASDVTTEDGAKRMVSETSKAFDREPDTLIHLVGGFGMAAVEDTNAADVWNKMIALNLTSAFQCYRAILPALRARGGGWIVGMSSKAVRAPGARISAYAASKAAYEAFTASLSAEVRDAGIHVNLIIASTVDTPANRQSMGEDRAKDWVTADDIADATMYLCSEDARAVHGASLEVFANA